MEWSKHDTTVWLIEKYPDISKREEEGILDSKEEEKWGMHWILLNLIFLAVGPAFSSAAKKQKWTHEKCVSCIRHWTLISVHILFTQENSGLCAQSTANIFDEAEKPPRSSIGVRFLAHSLNFSADEIRRTQVEQIAGCPYPRWGSIDFDHSHSTLDVFSLRSIGGFPISPPTYSLYLTLHSVEMCSMAWPHTHAKLSLFKECHP